MKSLCADHGENWRQDCEACAMAQRTTWHSLRLPGATSPDRIAALESQLAAAERERDSLKGDRDKFLASDDCYYWTPEAQKERDRLREAIEGDTLTAKRVYKLLEQRDELAAALDEARAESERISKIVTDNAIQYAKELADAFSERDRLRAENEKLVKALNEIAAWDFHAEGPQAGSQAWSMRIARKALADAGRGREG